MKYIKVLGLLAIAAAALMAFAASASATTITSPTGTVSTAPIHAESEGTVILDPPSLPAIECHSTVESTVETHGAAETAEGRLSALTFTNCNDSWHVTPIKNADNKYGTLVLHAIGNYNGTLTSSNTKVSATRFGVTCTYATNNTHIGTATGGNPATLHIEANIPIVSTESSGLCGTGSSAWEGSYESTGPVYID